jgi:hypothetical protein
MRKTLVDWMRSGLVVSAASFYLLGPGPGLSFAAEGAATPPKPAAPAKKTAGKPAKTKAAAKAAPAVKETIEGEDVRDFRSFCDTWMGKLRDRNTYNESHITWDNTGGQVVGEYVTYGTDRTCSAREEPGKDPIGKITYREVRYRRQGATPTAAMAGAGTVVEQTDVTEIFRFAKGRWQY